MELSLSADHLMELSPDWEYVADSVMGGVSAGALRSETVHGRHAQHLTGHVSLENNGGFVQMAFDLHPDGTAFDASGWTGLELDVVGNGEVYDLRLRTDELRRPWQSFRSEFTAYPDWKTCRFAFADFEPHRTDLQFDPAQLRRVGLLGIGRPFDVDLAVSAIRLYRN